MKINRKMTKEEKAWRLKFQSSIDKFKFPYEIIKVEINDYRKIKKEIEND